MTIQREKRHGYLPRYADCNTEPQCGQKSAASPEGLPYFGQLRTAPPQRPPSIMAAPAHFLNWDERLHLRESGVIPQFFFMMVLMKLQPIICWS